MRGRLSVALIGAAVTCALVVPGVAHPQAGDSAVGTVTLFQDPTIGDATLNLDAHSGPSGETPTGSLALIFPQFPTPIEGSVACVRVSGNTAIIGVNFVNAGVPAGFFKVVDGPIDTLNLDLASAVLGEGDCPADVTANPQTITSGDLVVVDAVPLPTSEDQCKNGGWRAFGVFKNQGDCVSFVATKGKNPPANSP